MKLVKLSCMLVVSAMILGCGKDPAKGTADGKKTEPVQSTPSQIVDAMTGKTAIDQGKRAMKTIRDVSAKENNDAEEAMSGKYD
mgnify:CR=1 FL=1